MTVSESILVFNLLYRRFVTAGAIVCLLDVHVYGYVEKLLLYVCTKIQKREAGEDEECYITASASSKCLSEEE
jgi:hypothetical protein